MKYLKRIFEATENTLPDEIVDNFLNIYDVYGDPEVKSKTINGITTYELIWDTGLNDIDDTKKFRDAIYKISKIIDDLDSAKGRLSSNYDFSFSFSPTTSTHGRIWIKLKNKSAPIYNFVTRIDIENKNIYLNKKQIKKFFEDNNIAVSKMQSDKPLNIELERLKDVHHRMHGEYYTADPNEYLYIQFSKKYGFANPADREERIHFQNILEEFEKIINEELLKSDEFADVYENSYSDRFKYSWLVIQVDEYYIILK